MVIEAMTTEEALRQIVRRMFEELSFDEIVGTVFDIANEEMPHVPPEQLDLIDEN